MESVVRSAFPIHHHFRYIKRRGFTAPQKRSTVLQDASPVHEGEAVAAASFLPRAFEGYRLRSKTIVGISGPPLKLVGLQRKMLKLCGRGRLHNDAVKGDFLTARFRLARPRNWQVNVFLFPDYHGDARAEYIGFTLSSRAPVQHLPVRQTQAYQ
jgi:hypothetical protein